MKINFKAPNYVDEDKVRQYLKKELLIKGVCVTVSTEGLDSIFGMEDLRYFCYQAYNLKEEESRYVLCVTSNGNWFGRTVKHWVTRYSNKLGFTEQQLLKECVTNSLSRQK